jgi:hypothetical protein
MKLLGLFMSLLTFAHGAAAFVHPGLLHSRADLDRIKSAIAAQTQPVFAGWEIFARDPSSQPAYVPRGPAAEIGRNPGAHQAAYDADATAAYHLALRWALTGDRAAAAKAIALVNAWSATLTTVSGRDAVLMAGLGPFKMVYAAELLRHTATGWPAADIARAEHGFRAVIYPALQNFAPFANGNWDTAAIKTVLAIGVFCDDRALYERALRYYVHGPGNGRLTHYILDAAGQSQESGRDQGHTQLGLGHLGDACEIAWHQGLDLYAYADNRLLAGFDYTAHYNLGADVPFAPTIDRTGKYRHPAISQEGRGRLRPIYEQILNHYVTRRSLAAPGVAAAVARLRPEGASRPTADHPGFGTLLFAAGTNDAPPPAAPASTTYTVTRAEHPSGPFTTISRDLTSPHCTDTAVTPGRLYTYIISAGGGLDSAPITLAAGLPPPWRASDHGPVTLAGHTAYDGQTFTLEGAGCARELPANAFHFAALPLTGDGAITARFVPPPSSQFTHAGLAFRTAAPASPAQIALVLAPEAKGQVEYPSWSVRCLGGTGPDARELGRSAPLPAPQVLHGRLNAPLWLRLTRSGDTVTGEISLDGTTWTTVASAIQALPPTIAAGLTAASHVPDITTTVTFDHVSAPGWPAK